MSSDYNYSIEILNNFIAYLNRYIVPVLCIIGNIGHFLNALVFAKKSWRKNVCVFYFNVCLITNTCYINSTMLTTIFTFGLNINLHNSNVFLCKIYYYTAYLFSSLLPTFLILASIDRLLISSQNVDTRLYSSKRLAYFSVSISTIFWIIFNIHVLIKVNIQQFGPSTFICYYDLSPLFYYQFVTYSSLTITCCLYLIMIILSILSFKNVRRIRSIPRQQQRHVIRTMTKKDFQLLRCLFVQDIVFITFTSGFLIFSVYQTVTVNQIRTPLEQAIVDFVYKLCIFLNQTPYYTSFFIFFGISKAFRNELRRMVYKIRGKDITLIRDEEIKPENVGANNLELNIAVVNHIEL